MSKVHVLRALVQQRLTVAAEEIFGLFERTVAEYEEELCRSREENERHRKLLDAVFNPEVRLHTADVQQLLGSKEEVPPEQQEWSPLLDQEDPEPPHIKEEQEELWSSQDGEQLHRLEETDISKFTPVPVKSEDDEEKPQTSQLHQTETEQMRREAAGEDCGGPEPARNSDPERHLQPDDKSEDSSETDDSDENWTESRKPLKGLNSVKNSEVPVSDGGSKTGKNPFKCCVCGKRFDSRGSLKLHVRVHTGEKPFSCSFCGKRFSQKGNSVSHMRIHTGEKPFSCSICEKRFRHRGAYSRHMRVHSGKKTLTTNNNTRTASGRAGSFDPHRRSQTGSRVRAGD